ncbi:MAG: TIGR03960 family B12-binding radical SAM protein [Phycisphaerae bacterium]|jgi:radical SAM family uncharacterized protein
MSSLRERISEELLPFVEQPAQYIGGEWNQLVRPGDWERAEIRVAVAFPDTYTIGMSHLGCQILYWLCNHTPGVCAERTYAPWIDAEKVMRDKRIPLFTWDTRQPVADADMLAISLQYELCFTTVLNLLDLAGVPLLARDRTDAHPLVIAGGPQADNPEPMAEFLDLVVIGDGEHSMAAILEAYREYKRAGVPRREMIVRMARRFPWIYAPNLYEIRYQSDGTIAERIAKVEGIPERIERCKTPDFEDAPFPRRPLVPWVEVVHDRIAIEIMRGCPQVCRFCHAGYTKRPLHYRSPDRILEIAEEAYWATGHKEIGLLSLSTADYPLLPELAAKANERFAPRMVNLSFPSLRIDRMLQNIPWMGSGVRKGGITMAVEAARDDMRRAIRKKVTDGNLMEGVREVYRAGWNRVKLYFMSGFPGERDDDITGIWNLSNAVSLERRSIGQPPAHVIASVGWLVPKPFTPLQWMAQPRAEYYRKVQERLKALATKPRRHKQMDDGTEGTLGSTRGGTGVSPPSASSSTGVPPVDTSGSRFIVSGSYGSANEMASENEFMRQDSVRRAYGRDREPRGIVTIKTHDPQRAILEAVFARGDRRLGAVIHEAWRRGARFDGWDECYNDAIWQQAYAATGVDPDWYAHRERRFDEALPWDFIGLHMRRSYLEDAYDDVFKKVGAARPLPVLAGAGPPAAGPA